MFVSVVTVCFMLSSMLASMLFSSLSVLASVLSSVVSVLVVVVESSTFMSEYWSSWGRLSITMS